MSVMDIPSFPRPIEILDLETLFSARLNNTVVEWPCQAIPLLGYMCHPNDEAERAGVVNLLRSWPDFFGYSADRKLKCRGRLDEGRKNCPRGEAPRELVEAMRAIVSTGLALADQNPSLGCSIKWKDAKPSPVIEPHQLRGSMTGET